MDWPSIRGFNYQPSNGSTGFEIWRNFDLSLVDVELSRGKRFFPGMNAIRLWLSWDAFLRDPKRFAFNFDGALQVADRYGLQVMPVLFNRWHDSTLDYGGIYVDHFVPRLSWVQRASMFEPYLDAIVGGHADDDRLLAWDLCNEPFSYGRQADEVGEIERHEYAWLEGLYQGLKSRGAKAPVTVGIHPGTPLDRIEPISDVISIHPYWIPQHQSAESYGEQVGAWAKQAAGFGKPLVATECCWGHTDDEARVEQIRVTLETLKAHGIGWLVYLLHHSLIADAHRAEYGPMGFPANLSFIEADGTLRPGHDVFNAY